MARASARRAPFQQEAEQATQRRNDLLSLLALGYGFQVRLTGQVVAAHADRLDEQDERGHSIRPVLTAALAGRLAPVAEQWLGIDPDQVVVSLHRGPGWGSVELTGPGEERRLQVSLPAEWLARVWAAGLALAGRHLVVAVHRAGWPDARVLALRAPGTEPVPLDVHAAATASPVPRCATLGDMSPNHPAVEALGVAVAARVPVLLWGRARHRQDVRDPRDGRGHGAAVRDGDRLDPGAFGLRRAAHRGR